MLKRLSTLVAAGAFVTLLVPAAQALTPAPLPTETFFSMAYDMDTPFHVVGSVQDHGSYRGVVDISAGRTNLQPVAFSSEGGGIGTDRPPPLSQITQEAVTVRIG